MCKQEKTMNITLSADEKLVTRTRHFAAEHGTSLNQMIRDYMRQIANLSELKRDAEEFAHLAATCGGKASRKGVFNREEIHRR